MNDKSTKTIFFFILDILTPPALVFTWYNELFMRSQILKFTILIILGVLFLKIGPSVLADINSDCQNESAAQIVAEGKTDTCTQILKNIADSISVANTTNQKNLTQLQSQLSNLTSRITALSDQLQKTAVDINLREEKMAYTKELFNQKARDQYTFLRLYDPISPFIFSDTASQAFQEISLRQKAADADRKSLDQYAQDLIKLKNDEDSLQKSKDALTSAQKQVSDKANFLAGEVAKASAYLATLSAKQEAFLAAKLDSLGLSRSAYNMKGGCSSDISPFKDPGFPSAIGFFTFGVPNRIGLNQFGAKGRAEAGQNAQTILSAYYNADYTTGYSQSVPIHVVGTNEFGESIDSNWSIEDYLIHLYEMPTDFPQEALRAQAIAARSFALAYTNNGGSSICPSQQCQVVKNGAHGSDAWTQAVHDTAGIVITSGGTPIKAWFSSTHGGYAYTSADIGWSSTPWTKRLQDTTGGINSFSDLSGNAYDKSSPVFYCDWGSRAAYNKTAWLTSGEVADIANVILLAKADGSTQDHLTQVDKPNPDGVDTWDAGTVKSKLLEKGITPLDSASDVSISADFGSGKTTTVTIDGKSFDGQDFKTYFNLRAPSNIQIVGPLFNVEKR
jgi:peptidoglycan hydrolase-like amidase/peptidoglycan hydrolase CwlO-like protein